jgi:hypothetical protein
LCWYLASHMTSLPLDNQLVLELVWVQSVEFVKLHPAGIGRAQPRPPD